MQPKNSNFTSQLDSEPGKNDLQEEEYSQWDKKKKRILVPGQGRRKF